MFNGYAGTGLVPLPYESALGSLLRFGWRNRMNLAMLAPLCFCSQSGRYSNKFCHQILSWISSEKFESVATWRIPSKEEISFSEAFKKDHHIWLSETFRYCPLCLEMGYHSFVHQFLGICSCPLHRVELVTKCSFCDEKLPDYKFRPDLFFDPLICKCGKPISGVEPSLELDEIIRLQTDTIDSEFKVVFDWCVQSEEVRNRIASALNVYRDLSPMIRSLGDTKSLIRDACFSLMPPPFSEIQSSNQKSQLIQWRIRAYSTFNFDLLSMEKRLFYSNNGEGLATGVYRCVVRSLVNWIKTEEKIGDEEFSSLATIKGGKVRSYNPKILAYMCMRSQLESQSWSFSSWNVRSARLSRVPNIEVHRHQNRAPKSAWRAFFYGLFVSWYGRVLNHQDEDAKSLVFRLGAEGNDILMFSDLLENWGEKYWVGGIILPDFDFLLRPPFLSKKTVPIAPVTCPGFFGPLKI